MDPWKTQAPSFGRGFIASSTALNEFFGKSDAEKPSWMSAATESTRNEQRDEENLLDDAYSSYMSTTLSIDSSKIYSSLGSQESDYNDHGTEAEVVLRVAVCCGKCEDKAKSLSQLEGVTSVVCDRKTEKVIVTGNARPRDVLEACRKLFEQAEMWSPNDNIGDLNPAAP